MELINVFQTGEASLVPVVESLLRAAGIEFLVKNEALQVTIPGASYALGPVQFWVSREHEADVRELLAQINAEAPETAEPGE